jgi:hypothetical protein
MYQIPETLVIDGVVYKLPQWLDVGQSIFIPCVNWQRVSRMVRAHYAPTRWELDVSPRVERSLLGLRLWRLG